MKGKITLFGIAALLLAASSICYSYMLKDNDAKVVKSSAERSATGMKDYLSQVRGNKLTGEINYADVALAREQSLLAAKQKDPGILEWEELGPSEVGGRTRAFLIDKNNYNKLYAGGVGGGLFVSENAGDSWNIIQSSIENGMVAVSSICQSADGTIYVGTGEGFYNPSGEKVEGLFGSGIYKSTDGVNFELLVTTAPATNPANFSDDFALVNKMAAHPVNANIIYAATERGLFISENAGETWARAKSIDGNEIPAPNAYEVKAAPNGIIHAVINSKYYRSTDGLLFERMTNTDPVIAPASARRGAIAICQSQPNYVYIVVTDTGGCMNFVAQSTDGGINWVKIGVGTELFDPFYYGTPEIPCQGWYDLAIGVDPLNPEIVYIAGLTLWKRNVEDGFGTWTEIDNLGESPSNPYYVHADKHDIIFRPDNSNIMYIVSDGGVSKSLDASNEFPTFQLANRGYAVTQFYGIGAGHDGSAGGGSQDNGTQYLNYNFNSISESVEVMGGDGGFFEVSNISPNALFAGNPGGELSRSSNGGQGFGNYFDCNIDCATTGSSSSACNADGAIDGGAGFVTVFHLWEDKSLFDTIRNYKFPDNTGGIGVVLHNDQEFIITSDASLVPAEAYENPYDEPQIFVNYDLTTNSVREYGPSDYRYKRARMFTGGNNGKLWMTEDALNFGTTPFWVNIGTASSGGFVSAIDVVPNGNTVWFGTSNGKISRVRNVNSIPIHDLFLGDESDCNDLATYTNNSQAITISGLSGRFVTDIAINPSNPAQVVVVAGNYSENNYVWVSNNATSDTPTWTPIQNNLPKMPVYDVFIAKEVSSFVFIGTEYGVWRNDLSSNNNDWTPEFGTEMGAIPVFSLRQEKMARIPEAHLNQVSCEGFTITSSHFDAMNVIYAGVHGRGLFRSTSLANFANPTGDNYSFGPNCETYSVFDLPDFDLSVPTSITTVGTSNTLSVYPNPVADFATIELGIKYAGTANLKIYNVEGKLVKSVFENRMIANGTMKENINLQNLASGNYILVLQTSNGNISRQLVKQ